MNRFLLSGLLICLFSLTYGQARVTLKEAYSEKKHQIVCVAYSPNSELVATGAFDNQIIVRNSKTGNVIHTLKGLRGFPLALAFSPDSKYLVSGGKDSRITIWDLSNGSTLKEIKAHKGDITDVAVSDNKTIATSSKDKTAKIWDFSGNLLHELNGHKKEVMAIAFSHNGKLIATASADGTVKEWEASSGKNIQTIEAHNGWVRTVAFNHNSTLLASGGDDGKINIWNKSNGKLQNSIIAHSKWLENLSFSPDGKYVASGGHDNYLVIVNAITGQIVFNSPKQDYYVLSTAFDPSGKYLASSVLNSTVLSIWDVTALNIQPKKFDSKTPQKVFEKPTIKWITENNQKTNNLTFKVNAKIISDSPLSSVDIYLNNNRFSSDRDIEEQGLPINLSYEKILYLNEGDNQIQIIAYNNTGEALSENLNISYFQPAPEPEIVADVTHDEKEEVKVAEEYVKQTEKFEVNEEVVEQVKLEEEIQVDEDLTINKPTAIAKPNPYRFALIIGNEDYSTFQTGLEKESDVAFAINDATAFKEYAMAILGVPTDNIIFLTNARAIEMDDAIRKLNPIIKALNGKAEIFFYYAGHGFPDEKTKEPFLIPVDVSGSNLRFAVSLKELYQMLTEHPSARITVFLDACFSGGAREQGLMAARAVRVKPKEDRLKGNIVVFTASSGNESAHPYKEKKHGMFTYHLIEKLKETNGDLTYKELSEHLSMQVGVKSVMVNNMPQTPQTNFSFDVEEVWGDWKLR